MGLGQVDHQSQPELPGEFQKKSELQVGVCLKKKLNMSWRAINENNWSQPLASTCMGTHKGTYTERIQCFSGEKNQYLDSLKY